MKCYAVKLQDFFRISPKCYKAVDFSGNEALIPASQFCGYACANKEGVTAVLLSAWILDKKNLVYSTKKPIFAEPCDDGEDYAPEIVVHHKPERKEPEKEVKADASLAR